MDVLEDKMTLDQTVYDYYDIVPRPREPTWAERHTPKLLSAARKHGYFLAPAEPAVVPQPFPDEFTVRMPEIPYDSKVHPLIRLCEMVEAFADRVWFEGYNYKEMRVIMNPSSFEEVIAVPFNGDDTIGGDAYFHSIALSQYVCGIFDEKKQYDVSGVGITFSGDGDGLTLRLLRIPKA